ncbi:hypothetical protein GCM10009590_14200 [Brachybacterium alimentarium]
MGALDGGIDERVAGVEDEGGLHHGEGDEDDQHRDHRELRHRRALLPAQVARQLPAGARARSAASGRRAG